MGRLFWKFFLSILLAQLTATLGIGGAFWLREQAQARALAPAIDTSPPAELMVEAASATLAHGGHAGLHAFLAGMQHHAVYAIDEQGRELLGRTVDGAMTLQARRVLASQPDHQVVREFAADDGHRYLLFAPFDGRRGGPAAGPRLDDRGPAGGRPFSVRPGPPPDTLMHWAAPLSGALVASLVFAALLAWYFSRPIRALRKAFDAVAAGDMAPHFAGVPGRRGDELTQLGQDFDAMSERLRLLMDGQRRLLHDVSHELRSPLARMQAAIGLAHQQPDKAGASLDRIERESVRMDKLVGELLTIARLEAAAPARHDDIALDELVAGVSDDATYEAQAAQRALVLAIHARATVRGAADLLWRALENVVRNAIRHSPPGATIEIALDYNDATQLADITVSDRGPGVAETDLEAIFEPFFRAHSDGNEDGHGLGLAIARRVIAGHGGSISAANRAGGGLVVSLALPATHG